MGIHAGNELHIVAESRYRVAQRKCNGYSHVVETYANHAVQVYEHLRRRFKELVEAQTSVGPVPPVEEANGNRARNKVPGLEGVLAPVAVERSLSST